MRKASESEGGHVAVCVPTWRPPKVLTFHHCLKKATRDQVKEEGGSRSARREIERWMCGVVWQTRKANPPAVDLIV